MVQACKPSIREWQIVTRAVRLPRQYGTARPARLAVARHVAVPVNEQFEWVQCTDCGKWRRLLGESAADLPDVWTCAMSRDALRNSCEAAEEAMVDGARRRWWR